MAAIWVQKGFRITCLGVCDVQSGDDDAFLFGSGLCVLLPNCLSSLPKYVCLGVRQAGRGERIVQWFLMKSEKQNFGWHFILFHVIFDPFA